MKRIKTAVLGSTGLVGQQFVRMLEKHPYFDVMAITASPKSKKKKYRDVVQWTVSGDLPQYAADMEIQDLNIGYLKSNGIKVVFSALPADVACGVEGKIRDEHMVVFSNAGAFRMDQNVPILIPEVNSNHLNLVKQQIDKYGGFIVTTSNCSTAGLVLALKPLMRFGLQMVVVSTYQAISGGGRGGVSGLDISGNVLPFIKNEEEKMETESKKIFGKQQGGIIENSNLVFQASCCRVPVRDGHLESVVVELKQKIDLKDIEKAWESFYGIPQRLKLPTAPRNPLRLRRELTRPQPILDAHAGNPARAKGMAVTVGRTSVKDRMIRFFLLVHNTIRGAAGNCILNAELAVKKGLI